MPKVNADGTTAERFQVDHDQDGPAFKHEAGTMAARNAADSGYAKVRGATPVDPNDLTTKLYADALVNGTVHENLDTLVHNIAESNHTEVVRTLGRVTAVIIWETVAMLKKVRETLITRTSGRVSSVVRKQYDSAGVVIVGQTLTGSITRTSGKVASLGWVET